MKLGRLLVRDAEAERDGELVSQLLRHQLRWQRLGLPAPPKQQLIDETTTLLLPNRRPGRLNLALLFDTGAQPAHLLAVLSDNGWDADADRVRLVALVWLDDRPRAMALRSPGYTLGSAWIFGQRRAHAIRALAGDGDALGAWLVSQGAETLALHHRTWAHLSRKAWREPALEMSATRPTISAREATYLGSFGPGGWPKPPRSRPAAAVEVRNPGVAHRHMLQSGGAWRRRFFPEAGPPQAADVLVVGAGLAGCCAAHALQPRHVTLLDLDDRVGGTAAAGDSTLGRFPLAAHYEHELATYFDPTIIALHQRLGIVETKPRGQLFPFVDRHYLVDPHRQEQLLTPSGQLYGDIWNLMAEPHNLPLTRRLTELIGQLPLPARLAVPELQALDRLTFVDWLAEQHLDLDPLLRLAIDTGLRSDYGGNGREVSAFAALHYLTCRPYLTGEPRTLSPPEGLAYFAERLLAHSPNVTLRLQHLVRRIVDRRDHLEVTALDTREQRTRRFTARAVVFAAPKKVIKWVFPADAHLFADNVYSAWIVVTMQMKRLPEKELLYWSNGIYDPRQRYVGVTWANHHRPDDPPLLGHYIVFPPGRWHHVVPLLDRPGRIVRFCLDQLHRLIGRDAGNDIERVVIQKMGHAMPTPVPGGLFRSANDRRSCERLVYAGVDTHRLPLLVEAFDSALDATGRLGGARNGASP